MSSFVIWMCRRMSLLAHELRAFDGLAPSKDFSGSIAAR